MGYLGAPTLDNLYENAKFVVQTSSGIRESHPHDINITKELYDILNKLNKEHGLTIIMATHDLEEIKNMNVRVICMATTIKFDGKIEDWKGF